jgi:hypothetical protein
MLINAAYGTCRIFPGLPECVTHNVVNEEKYVISCPVINDFFTVVVFCLSFVGG